MKFLSFRKLYLSFKYAFKGLKYIIRSQQTFRIEIILALIVIACMIYFKVTLLESVVLGMVIVFVLVIEVINTIFERMVDILKPRVHPYAEVMKDMTAACNLITLIVATIVGLIILIPYIVNKFF